MGHLSDYEHDIFVSYAHSGQLSAWSKRLLDDLRGLVALGLELREAEQVALWWDYRLSGHEPLTRQLRENVERSAVLVVLMSEWYLESRWCRDEREWFVNAVRQKRADHPVFVVRMRSTDHNRWPEVFKDDRGHPLKGYDFVRNKEDENSLGLPKGYPRPEEAPDGREYHEALSKLASDIVHQLRSLRPRAAAGATMAGLNEDPALAQRVCLAATPAEDIDELRTELAARLQAKGCVVLPEDNPLDIETIRQQAPEWISSCDKFVQVLGPMSGLWRHDNSGFVMYQYDLAQRARKPTFLYRSPSLETVPVKKKEYADFIARVQPNNAIDLTNLIENVIRPESEPADDGSAFRRVFVMADEQDKTLENEIRRDLQKLQFEVFPLARTGRSGRDVKNVMNERSFLSLIRRCGAILLIHGSVKETDSLWIDDRVSDIKLDIQRKLGGHPPYAIIDAPPPPRLEPPQPHAILANDSPAFMEELQSWLRALRRSSIILTGA